MSSLIIRSLKKRTVIRGCCT